MVETGKKVTRPLKRQSIVQLLSAAVILISLNIIGSFVFTRIDLTSEKRFSISPSTKSFLKNLDDVIYIKIYLDGDLPPGFKRLRNSTHEMLDEFRVYAKDNLEYQFIDPSA